MDVADHWSPNTMTKPDSSDAGSQISVDERRSEPRYPSVEAAVVTIITEGSSFEAETVDVSKSGLRIRLEKPLEVGSRIRVKFGTVVAFGEVRWCHQANAGNIDAGIRVEHTVAQDFLSGLKAAVNRVKEQGG